MKRKKLLVKKKAIDVLALVFSYAFEPFVLSFVMLLLFFVTLNPSSVLIVSFIGIYVGFAGFFYHGLQNGRFSDIELTDRHERQYFNSLAIGFNTIGFVVVLLLGNLALVGYYSIFYVWFLLFSLITASWKVSGHTGIATLVFFFINNLYGWHYAWLFFILPFVAWSRVYRHKHTTLQVIGGVILSTVVAIVGFTLFDL